MTHDSGTLRPDAVRGMFDRIAPVYDAMNRVMTAGLDRSWRRLTVEAVVQPGDRVLDACCGTGDLAVAAEREGGIVTGLDFSPRMLERARRKSETVTWIEGDLLELPFEDGSFDLVFGHAVLHHLPNLHRAFGEFRRVLKPGGVMAFAGEPSRYGDQIASYPKRFAHRAAPVWRALIRARPAVEGHSDGGAENHQLESQVDVHAFTPQDLSRHAKGAGFEDVRVRGEELLANWFGWTNRGLEASADPETVPMAWRQYAYHGYIALQKVDRALLEPRLPPAIFYNLMIAGRRP